MLRNYYCRIAAIFLMVFTITSFTQDAHAVDFRAYVTEEENPFGDNNYDIVIERQEVGAAPEIEFAFQKIDIFVVFLLIDAFGIEDVTWVKICERRQSSLTAEIVQVFDGLFITYVINTDDTGESTVTLVEGSQTLEKAKETATSNGVSINAIEVTRLNETGNETGLKCELLALHTEFGLNQNPPEYAILLVDYNSETLVFSTVDDILAVEGILAQFQATFTLNLRSLGDC